MIHSQTHGPYEQGKDVISVDSSKRVHAFQLKSRKITLTRWRNEILPEIQSLTRIPVHHPAATGRKHCPYLVTNACFTDPVIGEINAFNLQLRQERRRQLVTINGTNLASRFLQAHGRFLPREPRTLDSLFRLYLAEGTDMLPKGKLAGFLQRQLAHSAVKRGEVQHAAPSAAILAAYALSPFERMKNRWALVEGWTLVAANVARIGEELRAARPRWDPCFMSALNAAKESLGALTEEALQSDYLLAGEAMMDGGPPYRARLTILLGAMAAHGLLGNADGCSESREELLKFTDRHLKHAMLWGESAIPFYLSIALFLERSGRTPQAEELVSDLIGAVTCANAPASKRPLPNPYYSAEACVAVACGVKPPINLWDESAGQSYTLEVLIEFLSRRLRKQRLRELWKPITAISLLYMQLHNSTAYYRWRTRKATLRSRFVPRPTRWSDIRSDAARPTIERLPSAIRDHPEFALLFMLTYPHRLNRELLFCIEEGLAQQE